MTHPGFLPFALPDIGEEEIAAVVACLRSGWITTGPKAREFETDFARFIGGGVEAVAVNSATAGLHLALEALGIGPGDKVLTTPYTFTATAEVIRYLGAEVVFADIDPRTFNLDPASAAAVLDNVRGIKAMIPVHFAGQACDMGLLCDLAERHGIPMVEDAAHALPTTHSGAMIGTLSRATVFSFYATKTIATGEGGMIVSRDPALLARARTMRLHGINRDVFDRYQSTAPSWYYEVVAPGFKYNLPDIAAALGVEQLKKAQAFRARREAIAARYTAAFRDCRSRHRMSPGPRTPMPGISTYCNSNSAGCPSTVTGSSSSWPTRALAPAFTSSHCTCSLTGAIAMALRLPIFRLPRKYSVAPSACRSTPA